MRYDGTTGVPLPADGQSGAVFVSSHSGGLNGPIMGIAFSTPRDPQGIPKAIWDQFTDNDFLLPPDRPLTVGAFSGGFCPELLIEPRAAGALLPEMPLFLTPDY